MKDLTTKNEGQAILKFTIPILMGNVFQQLYNIIDSIIVGKCLGKNSLAVVSSCFNIMFVIWLIVMGLTLGTNILIAKYYGAGDMDKLKAAIDTSFVFSFVAAVVITVLGFLISKDILIFFKIPHEIIGEAQVFLEIMLIGTIGSFGYNAMNSILRGLGDSKTPLYFLVISTVTNIILDLLLIVVLKCGSWGAAFATIIAQAFSFIGCLVYFNKVHPELKFNIKNICFDKNIFSQSLKIGFPAAMQKLFLSGGTVIIQILINGFGANCMVAFAVTAKIDSFAQMPAANLGDALSVFTAQNLGADKPHRVKNGYKIIFMIGTFVSLIITGIIMLFSENLIMLFIKDSSVIKIGVNYLTVVSLSYVFYSAMNVTNGVLLGIGKSFAAMISTVVSLWCVQIPISIFLSHEIGVSGIWIGIPAGWISGFGIRFLYYKLWERQNISKNAVKYEKFAE